MFVDGAILKIDEVYRRCTSNNRGFLDHRNTEAPKVVFGVVLDATSMIKTKNGQLYQRIKLIDETQNHHSFVSGKPYLHLFNFMKTPEELIPIQSIGDQVLMYAYNFKIYEESEIQGLRNKQHTSKHKIVRYQSDSSEIKTEQLKLRSQELFQWSATYFASMSRNTYIIRQVYDHSWYVPFAGQPFDILVRVIRKDNQQLTLVDKDSKKYTLQISDESVVNENQAIKIRDIQINEQNIIIPSESSNILTIPNGFKDHEQLFSLPVKQEVHEEKVEGYIPDKTLMEALESPEGYIYRVKAKVIDVLPSSILEALFYVGKNKKFNHRLQQRIAFSQTKEEHDLEIDLMIQLALQDSSTPKYAEAVLVQTPTLNKVFRIDGVTPQNYKTQGFHEEYNKVLNHLIGSEREFLVQRRNEYLIIRQMLQ